MELLLTVIVTWLSINFGLPASYDHPEVRFVNQDAMIEVRASVLEQEEVEKLREAVEEGHAFLALYDDASQTIYLPEHWSARSPADVSLLVHEMVHHLQNVGKVEHECKEARERPAYRAQARWLDSVGTTIDVEFKVDSLTLLVRTTCWH